MTEKIFALVDCNNFFVSCERAFNPSLESRPVVVLSNNDGVCVSRSQEAKHIGIPMAAPYFEFKDLFLKNRGIALSSNFELYGDMSARIMNILSQFTPEIEYYSVDEAFLNLKFHKNFDFQKYGERISETVYKNTGIPVSVGIARTKTLAKAANEISKVNPLLGGVLSFINLDQEHIYDYLDTIEVEDVWGVGRKSVEKLAKKKIKTAKELATADERIIRKIMTVTGMRTSLELKGTACIDLNSRSIANKSILVSRSFTHSINDLKKLELKLSRHIFTACKKLKQQKTVGRTMRVFLLTNRFSKTSEFQYLSDVIKLEVASNYSPDFISLGLDILRKIFKDGLEYKKIGIVITDIADSSVIQQSLLTKQSGPSIDMKDKLGSAVEDINNKFGSFSVQFGSMGIGEKTPYVPKGRSKRFSTRLDELLVVK